MTPTAAGWRVLVTRPTPRPFLRAGGLADVEQGHRPSLSTGPVWRRVLPVAAFLTATVCWVSDVSGAPVGGGVGRELGVHYGSPLRLSAHASAILDDEVEVVRGVDRLEGPELLVEAGIGGGRVAVGWGRRGTPYLHGFSVGLGVIRTWTSIDDPHGYEPGHTLGSLSGRSISLGATLRGELLYDFDGPGDRWGLGWSVGLVLW